MAKFRQIVLGSAALLTTLAGCGGVETEGEPEIATSSSTGALSNSTSWALGWVWWSGTDAPPAYSHNSAGGVNTVTSLGTGRYRVDLRLLNETSRGGNVHVVSQGASSDRCKVESWGPGTPSTTLSINVRCHTAAGAPSNGPFVLLYQRENAVSSGLYAPGAYLRADQPAAASYTPSLTYQWNPTGSYNTVTRAGAGSYSARLPGLIQPGGTMEVTAYGSGSQHCKVGSWSSNSTHTVVNVRCFSAAGAPADSEFTLNFHYNLLRGVGGYAWATNVTSASYTPSLVQQRIAYSECNSPTVTAGNTGIGAQFLSYPALSPTGSTALVTAFGSSANYCKVGGWSANGSGGTRVSIRCFDSAGSPANTMFWQAYLTAQPFQIC